MKPVGEMSMEELAGLVCETLQKSGIIVTLTGGSCVAIWSQGRYVSRDLDFIEEGPVPRRKVKAALAGLGFVEEKRYFVHPETEFLLEFPTGPLMVGDERVEKVAVRQTTTGTLRLLSPTDCVKDRLAAFYHWKDKQSLAQAAAVVAESPVDLAEVERWSIAEGAATEFAEFEKFMKDNRHD